MQRKTRNKISEFMAGAFVGLVTLAILAAVLGVVALYGDLMYGDPLCGFGKCVKVKP